jgi:type I restriction enzyme M protein
MAKQNGSSNIGFEDKLWQAADKLRGNMDASEYKHVVLGLIFLKYISDSFQTKYNELLATQETEYTDPEDRDEYMSDNVFWVPVEARWEFIQGKALVPEIGKILDEAMLLIEKENPTLKNILPKNYARPELDKQRLGETIKLIGDVHLKDKTQASKDLLGRVYEYFIGMFAAKEGRSGGEFYTPQSVVQLLVEMIEPYKGRVYDPCCGSGGMFVQSEKFAEEHGGILRDISVYGQESNATTWRLAKMNLAIRGIESNLGGQWDDTFLNDLHRELKADFILANPPFNMSDWGGNKLKSDLRWKYGTPPENNANYAWIQHFIHHLAPNGVAGFVLANGSMSSNTSGEGDIRKNIIEADLVDCMIALPGQLFYTTQIPVCLWFLARNKGKNGHRERKGETLFIDARKMGRLEDRVHRVLDPEEIEKIAGTYHEWRSNESKYEDVAGFCKAVTLDTIKEHDYVLTPGRYVGAEEVEDDGEPFDEKMKRLSTQLYTQMEAGERLDKIIKENLAKHGYGEGAND